MTELAEVAQRDVAKLSHMIGKPCPACGTPLKLSIPTKDGLDSDGESVVSISCPRDLNCWHWDALDDDYMIEYPELEGVVLGIDDHEFDTQYHDPATCEWCRP